MSSADIAVRVFRELETEDLRILHTIEAAMSKREFVPTEQIQKYAKIPIERIQFIITKLNKLGLIFQNKAAYTGHTLNYAGYDCLAINTLVKAEIISYFGQTLGVGKEADIYDALTPTGKKIAVKFHRLGRTSFRQTRRKRGYIKEHSNWLFQSHLAAQKEFKAMELAYQNGVSVPEPISQNRHIIAMGLIEGAQLSKYKDIGKPNAILKKIMLNIKKTYLKAHLIHADLSEYNIILKSNGQILIIDWPQAVKTDHPNAKELLQRDLKNTIVYFNRKFNIDLPLEQAYEYVTGKTKRLNF
jgi:RIO kinase 2